MLSQLHIENIAVIKSCDIDFSRGFLILTGETGAGKSIIIDAINLVLGARASKTVIRTGAKSCFVSALFTDINEKVIGELRELGAEPDEDGVLLISRELTDDGKSTCRINSRAVNASVLREIGQYLINIHGQHDNQALLMPEKHINFLDDYANSGDALQNYRAVYKELLDTQERIKSISKNEADKERKMDLLRYQIDELKNAKLKNGEEEALLKERALQINAQKILSGAAFCYDRLYGGEDSTSVSDILSSVESELSLIEKYDENLKKAYSGITDIIYQIEDIASAIREIKDTLDYSPGNLDDIELRLDLISKMKRKYGPTVADALLYLDKCSKELSSIERSDEDLKALREKEISLLLTVKAAAHALTKVRKEAAQRLENAVKNELNYLLMPKVVFNVNFYDDGRLTSNGADRLEFYISANVGEEPRPLSQIASGGEMSRIMLALKTVLSFQDPVGTLIFDEIDAGISGAAASKVGKKLFEISKGKQVICVTHLAQIAAFSDAHYYIEKKEEQSRTSTSVTLLDKESSIREIARLISGESLTEASIKNATELLSLASLEKV